MQQQGSECQADDDGQGDIGDCGFHGLAFKGYRLQVGVGFSDLELVQYVGDSGLQTWQA